MPVEKSAGGIVFNRSRGGKIEYLLICNRGGYWGFPKGLIEKGETLEQAAWREMREEAGLKNFVVIPGFKETMKFFFKVKYDYQLSRGLKMGQTVLKFVTYFLMRAESKNVELSFEHEYFAWLPLGEAEEKLNLKEYREILKKADEFLYDYFSTKSV